MVTSRLVCLNVAFFFFLGGGPVTGLSRSQFPNLGLNPGHSNESPES